MLFIVIPFEIIFNNNLYNYITTKRDTLFNFWLLSVGYKILYNKPMNTYIGLCTLLILKKKYIKNNISFIF